MAVITHRGFTFRTSSEADLDQLAAEVRLTEGNLSPGVAFARLLHGQHHSNPEKERARSMVFVHYRDRVWPGPLKILTMPGLRWPFERMLIGARMVGMQSGRPDATTTITAFENDPAIYRAAFAKIPGLCRAPVQMLGTRCIRTARIDRYVFGNIEDELVSGEPYDAAWLDWTGPITSRRMAAIQQFWDSACRHSLTITVMDARQSGGANRAIRQYGSVAAWVEATLVDGHTVYVHRYVGQGGVPVVQIMRAKDAS